MAPRKVFNINNFVIYDAGARKSRCLVENCNKELSGKRPSNIKRHYKLVHKKNLSDESDSSGGKQPVALRSKKNKKRSKASVNIEMDKKEFLKCCVSLVAIKNIPIRIFDDHEFFKKIIRPYEQTFCVNLNSENIGLVVEKASQEIKEIITRRVEHKMISLKVDIATRMEKSILCINIQYINDYKICINTIGTIEITKRHTAQFLREEIIKCLQDFKIDITQLYSNTTDNGANVIKVSKILQEVQEENINNGEDTDRDENFQLQIAKVFSVVRCAAHSLQLAACDVIKTIEPEVNVCRKIVKKLRTSIRARDINVNMPVLDNITSWYSTFFMINSILSQKDCIENLDDAIINEIDWSFMEYFISAFKPLADCNLKLQCEQYILGDFYRDWFCCELDLQDIAEMNCYASRLYQAMIKRKQKLFDNDAFVSALYLDPRFNFEASPLLSDDQKQVALNHLLKTYEMIKKLETTPALENDSANLSTTSTDLSATSGDKYGKLEQHIKQMITTTQSASSTSRNLKQKLSLLCKRAMEPLDTNILEYWKKYHNHDEELSQLAQVALSVPATQISVERAFSALSIILTKPRKKLPKKTLSNILLYKFNVDLLKTSDLDFIEDESVLD